MEEGLHKETLDVHVGVKISKTSKTKLDAYSKKHKVKQSEVVRFAIDKLVGK